MGTANKPPIGTGGYYQQSTDFDPNQPTGFDLDYNINPNGTLEYDYGTSDGAYLDEHFNTTQELFDYLDLGNNGKKGAKGDKGDKDSKGKNGIIDEKTLDNLYYTITGQKSDINFATTYGGEDKKINSVDELTSALTFLEELDTKDIFKLITSDTDTTDTDTDTDTTQLESPTPPNISGVKGPFDDKNRMITKEDIQSEEVRNYFIEKLSIDQKFPEHVEYLNNVLNFVSYAVETASGANGSISQDSFVELLNGDDGNIDSYSIQAAAKELNYSGVDGLEKPEFIEDDIQQQSVGNCWFLAGIGGINNSREGRAIIDKTVQENDDGSYTVTFPAYPEHTYTISAEQIASATSTVTPGLTVSAADKDKTIIALNLAAEQIMKDTDWRSQYSDENGLHGGWPDELAQLFSIQTDKIFTNDDIPEEKNRERILAYLANNPDNPNIVFDAMPSGQGIDTTQENTMGHIWYIKNYDPATQTVTYANPWDTSKDYKISFDDFMKYTSYVNIYNV